MEPVSAKQSTNVRVNVPKAVKWMFAAVQAINHRLAAALLERLFLTPSRPKLPANEQAFLATGHSERVSSPVGELAVWSWGEGRTVLVVHGWGSRASRYRTIAPALVAAGFRVVALEAPGHGLSHGRRSSLPETARAVRFIAERERDRRGALPWAVIGHSFGSAASIMAQQDGVRFSRNVFLAPSVDFDAYMTRVQRALGVNAPVVRRMVDRIERNIGFCWDALRMTEMVRDFTSPALIFHDPADPEVPFSDAEALAAAWPRAELVSTPGMGHRRLLHSAEVVGRIVEFLGSEVTRTPLVAPGRPPAAAGVPIVTPRWKASVTVANW